MNFNDLNNEYNVKLAIEPFDIVAKVLYKEVKEVLNQMPSRVIEMKIYTQGYDVTEMVNDKFMEKFVEKVLEEFNT